MRFRCDPLRPAQLQWPCTDEAAVVEKRGGEAQQELIAIKGGIEASPLLRRSTCLFFRSILLSLGTAPATTHSASPLFPSIRPLLRSPLLAPHPRKSSPGRRLTRSLIPLLTTSPAPHHLNHGRDPFDRLHNRRHARPATHLLDPFPSPPPPPSFPPSLGTRSQTRFPFLDRTGTGSEREVLSPLCGGREGG